MLFNRCDSTISFEVDSSYLPADCYQIFKRGERTSGVYSIQPKGSQLFQTYCQMTADSGWTVIQRRFNGSVDFDRLWLDYKTGFGELHGEFWLGLESFYQIAHQAKYLLRIELEDWKNKTRYIEYTFRLGGMDNNYTLQIGQVLTGDLSSAMSDCKALPFSTSDRDNDLHTVINCAKQHSGGWWFSACGEASLNGKYLKTRINRRSDRKKGIFWKTWKGNYYSFKSTLLMVRPMRILVASPGEATTQDYIYAKLQKQHATDRVNSSGLPPEVRRLGNGVEALTCVRTPAAGRGHKMSGGAAARE
uniref:angiopoietin-related protein 4-like n=1 Tax=Pristiophorus japonicus TaxID=55135 RepID=UPI00398F29AA